MIKFTPEQRILVTGASSGIGRAVAILLNSLEATVIAHGRDTDKLAELKAAAPHPERLHTIARDLTEDMDALPGWMLNLSREYGKLFGLAFCAGQTWNLPMQSYDISIAHKAFDICCHAPLLVARGFCDRRVNTGSGASLVFIAALAGVSPNAGQVIYGSAKAALITGVRGLAQEIAGRKIRANCISPGLVDTPMVDATVATLGAGFLEREAKLYPLGLGKAEDVAHMTAFLLSNKSCWMTGQNVLLTGGR